MAIEQIDPYMTINSKIHDLPTFNSLSGNVVYENSKMQAKGDLQQIKKKYKKSDDEPNLEDVFKDKRNPDRQRKNLEDKINIGQKKLEFIKRTVNGDRSALIERKMSSFFN